MYEIVFYRDKNGVEPVREYLMKLAASTSKDSRINLKKIQDYVKSLGRYGTRLGKPYVKYIEDGIWELRPLKNRIMFFGYDGNEFVLLSHFIKKTKKTPRQEIEKAKRLMRDYIERSKNNGK